MSRTAQPKTKTNEGTPLDKKQSALNAEAASIRARIEQARQFIKDAPTIKAEAQRKEQRELLNRHRKVTRIEGPPDFRLELVKTKPGAKPRTLRRERSLAPMFLTLVLLVGCGLVFYYLMNTFSRS